VPAVNFGTLVTVSVMSQPEDAGTTTHRKLDNLSENEKRAL
jgi:hypothetical protein